MVLLFFPKGAGSGRKLPKTKVVQQKVKRRRWEAKR